MQGFSESVLQEIARRIQAGRALREWSVTMLAIYSGLSASIISRLEAGKRAISLESLFRIALALECEPADLLPSKEQLDAYATTAYQDFKARERNRHRMAVLGLNLAIQRGRLTEACSKVFPSDDIGPYQ